MEAQHEPVLLQEVIKLLSPQKGDFAVDCTVNGGGHATAILEKIGETGRLLGLDWDSALAARAKKHFAADGRVMIKNANYASLPKILSSGNFPAPNIVLADLGFSSAQLESGRGFSFQKDEPLLMTYNKSESSAAELLNSLPEDEIADIIFRYGGERKSRRIARSIIEARRKERIMTTAQLAEIVAKSLGRGYERGRIHPATRTFQAIRIAVNKEMQNLETLLAELPNIMASNGRVAIITFHSLEDALVKKAFRQFAKDGRAELLTKKPIGPSREEVMRNPRSRSAKVRGICFF